MQWPTAIEIIEKLLSQSESKLLSLMVATAISVAFCGMLRYDDLSRLYVDELSVEDTHIVLSLEKRKNDQYREGKNIPVAALTGSIGCPVQLVRRLIRATDLDQYGHRALFSPITTDADGDEWYGQQPVSYF